MLLVVGGGLFGSLAAAYARCKGVEVTVFDADLAGAASPAAAGLFKEDWTGKKLHEHFVRALPVLDQLFGIRHVTLTHDDGREESLLFVRPSAILEPAPIREHITAVGDGWVEACGRRWEGDVYLAAGVWSEQFLPGLGVVGKAGSAFVFEGERPGRIRPWAHGKQAIAFVRDAGATHFADGTAEIDYTAEHDRRTLARAADLGLTGEPIRRHHGLRPYVPGGPVFVKLSPRTWLATGGRKMGTLIGASFASRLIEDELSKAVSISLD